MKRPGKSAAKGMAGLAAGLIVLLLALLAPQAPLPGGGVALAQQMDAPPNTLDRKRGPAAIWRDLRLGRPVHGTAPFAPPVKAITIEGEEWRKVRGEWLVPLGGGLLLAALVALGLFAAVRGRVPIAGGRCGRKVPRFSQFQRLTHWYMAGVFILLAISGLILLFGRVVLIPLIGREAFAAVASGAKQGHNLFGPLFIIGLIMLLPAFVRGNRPFWQDITWWLKGGFLFRKDLPAGKFNGGEKLWFWLIAVLGTVIAVSGIFLDFPFLAPDLLYLQFSQILHAASAVLLVAYAFGHVYLGSVGTEGTLEGMTTGCVDENWVRQHHSLWLQEARRRQQEGQTPEERACQPLSAGEKVRSSGSTATGEEAGA